MSSVTRPAMRSRTTPFGSTTQVSGTMATPNATVIAPSGSRSFGHEPPSSSKNARTAASVSSTTTEYSSTGSSAPTWDSENATRSPCSSRQGTHVELKKLSTTQLPLRRARSNGPSSMVVVRTSGAGRPSSGDSTTGSGPPDARASIATRRTRTTATAAETAAVRRGTVRLT